MSETKQEMMAELTNAINETDDNIRNEKLLTLARKLGAAVRFPNEGHRGPNPQIIIGYIVNAIQAHHTERQTNALLDQVESSGRWNLLMMAIAFLSMLAAWTPNIITMVK